MLSPEVASRKFTVSSSFMSLAPLTDCAITVPWAGPKPGRKPKMAPVIPPANMLLNLLKSMFKS